MTKLLPTIPKAVKNQLIAVNQTVASMMFAALKVRKRLLAFFKVRATLDATQASKDKKQQK